MENQSTLYGCVVHSAMGPVSIISNGRAIVGTSFGDLPEGVQNQELGVLAQACKQMKEYFSGTRKQFELPLEMNGTPFQKRVWNALLEIPYGETCSYKQIAIKVGNSKATRAVGMANNRNPIGIIVPCHRVIGANGALVGYAGGLSFKKFLLELESNHADD